MHHARRGESLAIAALAALSSCLSSPDFFGDGRDAGADAGSVDAGRGGGGALGGGPGGMGGTGGMGGMAGAGGGFAGGPPDAGFTSTRASRSSTIARVLGRTVAVNPDLPMLMVDGAALELFPAGSEPSAVAALPNGDVVVTLRHAQELAYVTGLFGGMPSVSWRTRVCSEPAGVALSPSGRTAVVACLGESLAVLVDTVTRSVTPVTLGGPARAVAVTNDGDGDDSDERAYVAQFWGVPVEEGTDRGRIGRVHELSLSTRTITATIDLRPIADLGFGPTLPGGGESPVHPPCAPNLLYAIAIANGRAFVSHTCVAPEAPLQKFTTLGAGVSVIDLGMRAELTTLSTTLNHLGRQFGPPDGSLFGVPIDVDVDPSGQTLAVVSQAGAAVLPLRVTPFALQPTFPGMLLGISLLGPCGYVGGCPDAGGEVDGELAGVPIGLVLIDDAHFLVNDWTGRSTVEAGGRDAGFAIRRYAPPPPAGTPERSVLLGKKFFFTGLGRWADRAVGSCGSCHPDGLSDNVTWVFGTGPRQTPSLDGTFAKGDKTDHRAQNWTAVFDEVYDVEGVTRNILGGRGALVGPMDIPIALGDGVDLGAGLYTRNDGLSGSAKAVDEGLSRVHDWADVEAYVQTIRPNRAPVWVSVPGAQLRGRMLFSIAGCAKCHGGPKWTVSRVPYDPSPQKNGSLPGDNGLPSSSSGLRLEARDGGQWPLFNDETLKVAVERLPNPDGGVQLSVGPERITCVLRNVGTFDPADPLERKTDGTRAQGALGFNPPSLLGLATSAPYLHHGKAPTLRELFTAPALQRHFTAGNGAFMLSTADVDDLVAFVESIDADTPPFPKSELVDLCGGY